MRRLKSLFYVLTFLVMAAAPALGCLCSISPAGPKEAKKFADAVFAGEIIAFEREGDSALFTFKVESVWKGVTEKQIVLVDPMHKSSCDSGLQPGQRYIIFAHYEDYNPRTEKLEILSPDKAGKPRPVIYPCSGSAHLANPLVKKKILKKLGKGRSLM